MLKMVTIACIKIKLLFMTNVISVLSEEEKRGNRKLVLLMTGLFHARLVKQRSSHSLKRYTQLVRLEKLNDTEIQFGMLCLMRLHGRLFNRSTYILCREFQK